MAVDRLGGRRPDACERLNSDLVPVLLVPGRQLGREIAGPDVRRMRAELWYRLFRRLRPLPSTESGFGSLDQRGSGVAVIASYVRARQ